MYVVATTENSKPSMHLMTWRHVYLDESNAMNYRDAHMLAHPVLQPGNETLETGMYTLRDDRIFLEGMINKWKLKDNMDLEI